MSRSTTPDGLVETSPPKRNANKCSNNHKSITKNTTKLSSLKKKPCITTSFSNYTTATSYPELRDLISVHEQVSEEKFTIVQSTKGFPSDASANDLLSNEAKSPHVRWEYRGDRLPIEFSGIPYVQLGYQEYQCQHGKDINKAYKERLRTSRTGSTTGGSQPRARRKEMQTIKANCPVSFCAKKLLLFPEFSIGVDTKSNRSAASRELRDFIERAKKRKQEESRDGLVGTADANRPSLIGRTLYITKFPLGEHSCGTARKRSRLSVRAEDEGASNRLRSNVKQLFDFCYNLCDRGMIDKANSAVSSLLAELGAPTQSCEPARKAKPAASRVHAHTVVESAAANTLLSAVPARTDIASSVSELLSMEQQAPFALAKLASVHNNCLIPAVCQSPPMEPLPLPPQLASPDQGHGSHCLVLQYPQ